MLAIEVTVTQFFPFLLGNFRAKFGNSWPNYDFDKRIDEFDGGLW